MEVYFPDHGWSAFDPTPGSDSTPWQKRQAGNLQGREAFGFLAKRVGGALAPTLAPAGTLVRGVAGLDPTSVLIVGSLTVGACHVVFYARKLLARRRRKRPVDRQVSVSDARLYGRSRAITDALEGAGTARAPHETPEQYARRAALRLDEPAMEPLGEIYLYARFRDAVPCALAGEFGVLEPRVLAAIGRLEATQTVKG